MNNTLTALKGVRVGHSTHRDKLTGTTVVVFEKDFPMAYKTYGGSPGTFNTDAMQSGKSDVRGHSIFISGGSWTGLQAGGTIMRRLIEEKIGFTSGVNINPNLTGAIVFDLGMHISKFDPEFGAEAFDNVTTGPVKGGNVGAGTGTSVGKFQHLDKGKKNPAMKAGVGSARINLEKGIIVCALSVVNALGNVVRPDGSILAGNRDDKKKFKTFEDTSNFVTKDIMNTTITIVGTNFDLQNRENYERIAHIASHGQVRAINPVHTAADGDTVFVFSNEEIKKPFVPQDDLFWPNFTVDIIGQAAARAVQESIYDACRQAETIKFAGAYQGVIPSSKDYK